MKKKKKQYEQVVIKNEPLVPTTIGIMSDKENNPIGVILIFVILICMVLFLPNLTSFIESLKGNDVSLPSSSPSSSNSNSTEIEVPSEEMEYLPLQNEIDRTINGIRFQISLNSSSKQLQAIYTNVSGSNTFFISNKYYLELYSGEKQLLQRIKIEGKELVSSSTYHYDIKSAYNLGQIAYLVIQKMSEKDYPAITLNSLDDNNLPFLTCVKENETLIYSFEENENTYLLKKIKDSIQITKKDESTINEYKALTNSYDSIDGVDAELNPTTNGFSFDTTIDLNRVSIQEKKRILDNLAYYEKNTEAKVVSFELGSSGYTCT